MLPVILVALLLSLWFFRKNFKDGTVWMLATYVGLAVLFWNDYGSASAQHQALPKIVRDFLLLGMVGFVQSLAVAKRISIATAVIIIFTLFAGAYFLQEIVEDQHDALVADPVTEPVLSVDGEYLLELEDGASLGTLQAVANTRGWKISPAFAPAMPAATDLDDYYVLDVKDGDQFTAEDLELIQGVEYAEPNEVVQVSPLEQIPYEYPAGAATSLSINDPFADQQWAMRVLNMNDYYAELPALRPQKRAKIAILDTGIDASHEDISVNYFSIDAKYDNDPMGHGTHCAGIAAGTTNNSIGIGSLAGTGSRPLVEITSIKVLNAAGMGTQKSIIAGIIEATDEGADVISLSLGGPSNGSRQKAYSAAVSYARSQGAIVVAAAGNSNADAYNYAPANARGIITVSALDEYLLRAPFSNTVDRLRMGIAAPGVGIYSTTPNSTYKSYSGTSMACPFVAGLLGVMKAVDPDLDADTAYAILHETGRGLNSGAATGRVVQPAAALRALVK